MAGLTGQERANYVQQMFGRIAGRYNIMNRIMTFGQDMRWRRFVVKQAQLPAKGALLDLATGTGDIAFEAKINMFIMQKQLPVRCAFFATEASAVEWLYREEQQTA